MIDRVNHTGKKGIVNQVLSGLSCNIDSNLRLYEFKSYNAVRAQPQWVKLLVPKFKQDYSCQKFNNMSTKICKGRLNF